MVDEQVLGGADRLVEGHGDEAADDAHRKCKTKKMLGLVGEPLPERSTAAAPDERRVGIAAAISIDSTAAPAAIVNAMRKPVIDGTATPPKVLVSCASTTPITALADDVPSERIRVLSPLAAPVSAGGTLPMMSAGIAA